MTFNKGSRSSLFALAVLSCFAWQAPAFSQDVAPDNTAVNQRDRDRSSVTADQAPNNSNDTSTMRQIRKAVVSDSSLSTYAHNIKIISRSGKVTLKGPVRSEQEKDAIEAKATEIAGDGNVVNKLTVKSQNQ